MSVGQTPHTATLTSSSSGPMRGTGTVSMRRSFAPRYTAARMVFGSSDTRGVLTQRRSGARFHVSRGDGMPVTMKSATGEIQTAATPWEFATVEARSNSTKFAKAQAGLPIIFELEAIPADRGMYAVRREIPATPASHRADA